MLAFVDESGDGGRRVTKGSSPFFVIAIVTFADAEDAVACDQRINLLRRELALPDEYEFHFRHNSHRVRMAFLNAVAPYQFFYHGFALNKDPDKLYGPGFDHKESLYKFACRLLFENARPFLSDATVVIDGSGDRKFRDELSRYLRQRINTTRERAIKKVKVQRSRNNNLIQLADYVAGVVSRTVQGKPGAQEYRRLIAARQTSLRIWPQ
jgi:hypothetical protein